MNAQVSAETVRLFTFTTTAPKVVMDNLIHLVGAHWCCHCFGCLIPALGIEDSITFIVKVSIKIKVGRSYYLSFKQSKFKRNKLLKLRIFDYQRLESDLGSD